MAITKRSVKGSELTWAEMDANWDELINLLSKISVAGGNVGINTLNPQAQLHITHDSGFALQLSRVGHSNWTLMQSYPSTVNGFGIVEGATHRLFIAEGGNVLIGTTSDSGGLLQIGVSNAAGRLVVLPNVSDLYGCIVEANNGIGTYKPLTLSASRIQLLNGNVLINNSVDDGTGAKLQINGYFSLPISTYSTNATAGGGTLPANPAGFFYMALGGALKKVPYYNN